MRVGDLFEWIAAAAITTGAALSPIGHWHIPLALLVGAACLAYFARCHAATEFPKITIKLPKLHVPWPRNVRAKVFVSTRLWWQMHGR